MSIRPDPIPPSSSWQPHPAIVPLLHLSHYKSFSRVGNPLLLCLFPLCRDNERDNQRYSSASRRRGDKSQTSIKQVTHGAIGASCASLGLPCCLQTQNRGIYGLASWTKIKPSPGIEIMVYGESQLKVLFNPGLGLICVWETSPLGLL